MEEAEVSRFSISAKFTENRLFPLSSLISTEALFVMENSNRLSELASQPFRSKISTRS